MIQLFQFLIYFSFYQFYPQADYQNESNNASMKNKSNKKQIQLSHHLSILHHMITKLIIRISNEILHENFPRYVKSILSSFPGLFMCVNLNVKTSAFHLFEMMFIKGPRTANVKNNYGNNNDNNNNNNNNNNIQDLNEFSLDYSLNIKTLLSAAINCRKSNNDNNNNNNHKNTIAPKANEILKSFLKSLKHILNFFKSSCFFTKNNSTEEENNNNYDNNNDFNRFNDNNNDFNNNLPSSLFELFRDFDSLFEEILKEIYMKFNHYFKIYPHLLSDPKLHLDNKLDLEEEKAKNLCLLIFKKIEEVGKAMYSLKREERSSRLSDRSGERSLRISESLYNQLLSFRSVKGMTYCDKLCDSRMNNCNHSNNNNNNDDYNYNNFNSTNNASRKNVGNIEIKTNSKYKNNSLNMMSSCPIPNPIIIIDDDDDEIFVLEDKVNFINKNRIKDDINGKRKIRADSQEEEQKEGKKIFNFFCIFCIFAFFLIFFLPFFLCFLSF